MIEAQVFRQMASGGALDPEFARHAVDDLVIPVLGGYRKGEQDVTGIAGQAGG